MDNPHQVFETLEDRCNWDKYIDQVEFIDLSTIDREKVKDSITYLRRVLGEGFLKRAIREANPIYHWYFAQATAGARQSLIRLVESLKALDGSINFQSALKDIKRRVKTKADREQVTEKLFMVRVAHKFLMHGFQVEFDPVINISGKRGWVTPKKPDLRLFDSENGSEIIIEVSRMKASDSQQLCSHTFHAIWSVVMDEGMFNDPEALKDILKPRYILPYAVIHRGIAEEELKSIIEQIRHLIKHVRSTGRFDALIIPGTIEVGIASYDDHHLAKDWAANRGIKPNDHVVGPWFNSDEILRAKLKLRTELEQLPLDKPGMVILEASENLFFFTYDQTEVAPYLGEELKKYPQLLRAVFFHGFDGGSCESYIRAIGPHSFVQEVRSDGSINQSLIIRNPNCSHELPISTLKKLESCITGLEESE
jgi:hypothetical protein